MCQITDTEQRIFYYLFAVVLDGPNSDAWLEVPDERLEQQGGGEMD